jgi:peptidoglycan/LPS O-acetylase OafA/YrhL
MYRQDNDCDPGLTARDRANRKPLVTCAALWALSYHAAHLLLPRGSGAMDTEPLWGWALIALSVALGSLLAFYYLRFVRGLDELMRRIHIEALAVGFGVAFVFGMAVDLLAQIGLDRFNEITWAVMVMAYSLAHRRAQRAYCA